MKSKSKKTVIAIISGITLLCLCGLFAILFPTSESEPIAKNGQILPVDPSQTEIEPILDPTITNTQIVLPTLVHTRVITKLPTSTPGPSSTPRPTNTPFVFKSPTAIVRSNPIVIPAADCNCGIDYDCGNFSTHNQAQACFNSCGGSSSYNWSGLDRDRDGIACESLP